MFIDGNFSRDFVFVSIGAIITVLVIHAERIVIVPFKVV